jgi:hypothetical protein
MKIVFLKSYKGIEAGTISHPEDRISKRLISEGYAEEYKVDAVVAKKVTRKAKK